MVIWGIENGREVVDFKWEERFTKNLKNYGGTPFWAWNCNVEREVARQQIGYFDEMGMGGFVIHSRTGLGLSYLGKEYMERVSECVAEAATRDMKVWLYDEDRWPSGFAGGLVTENRAYRARYLVFTPWEGGREPEHSRHHKDGRLDLLPHGGGQLRGMYAITFQNRKMKGYRFGTAEREGEETWYLYEEEMEEHSWFNNQTYMDTLNPEAVRAFVTLTYEAYKRELGDTFGKVVTAMFTDEPQFIHKRFPEYEGSREPVVLPCTAGMETAFKEQWGFSLLERLPELVWEIDEDRSGEIRYCFHRFLAGRFAETYSDYLGGWCDRNQIALTGHMKGEDTLQSQAASLGEAMRNYLCFQIPGVDVLCDRRLYTTVKQAQSASRQLGRNKVSSEEYGVTNWDFDFVGHKLQGDWQAALGVTNRVHHLAWMSMEGEAKRDFPATIFYQSPWYREYATLERYFSRIRMVMEQGRPLVHVGVIHPIESFWMVYGGMDHREERQRQEWLFQQLTEWLLFGLIDFDFISEALLEQMPEGDDGLQFGGMCYQLILVPELLTLRKSTVERLQKLKRDGGRILFLGQIPLFLEGRRSEELKKLWEGSVCIKANRDILLESLEELREVEILDEKGRRSSDFLCQLRQNGEERWLFVANGRKPLNRDEPKSQVWDIMVKGDFQAEIWNAMDETVTAVYKGNPRLHTKLREGQVWTSMKRRLTDQDSLLIRWTNRIRETTPGEKPGNHILAEETLEFVQLLNADYCTREEPNVMMLDQACYQLDDGSWQGPKEVLRIENTIRNLLGYPLKMEGNAQPWADKVQVEPGRIHTVTLKFEMTAAMKVGQTSLAVERPEEKEFFWDGEPIPIEDIGYYADESIRRIRLGEITAGKHSLSVKTGFRHDTSLEWMYLLGDFSVQFDERGISGGAILLPEQENAGYGSLTDRGMPFYGGNIIYHSGIEAEEGEYVLEVSKFRAPLLAVNVDKKRAGIIAFAPYRLNLGYLSGSHDIEIISYGSRINTFGPVHSSDKETDWFGPGAWRTTGEKYCTAYQLKKTGILEAPRLFRKCR